MEEVTPATHSDPLLRTNLWRLRGSLKPPPTDLPVALAKGLFTPDRLENDFRAYREFAKRAAPRYLLVDDTGPAMPTVFFILEAYALDLQDDVRLIGRILNRTELSVTDKILDTKDKTYSTADRIYWIKNQRPSNEIELTALMEEHSLRRLFWPFAAALVRATKARIVLLSLLEETIASREWAG